MGNNLFDSMDLGSQACRGPYGIKWAGSWCRHAGLLQAASFPPRFESPVENRHLTVADGFERPIDPGGGAEIGSRVPSRDDDHVVLRRHADAAQQDGQMAGTGQQAAGAPFRDPPTIGGVVAVKGAWDVPGREGLLTATLRRADINNQKRGIDKMVLKPFSRNER